MSHCVKSLLALASVLTAINRDQRGDGPTIDTAPDGSRPGARSGATLAEWSGEWCSAGRSLCSHSCAYGDVGVFAGRVRVAVPRMGLGEKAATGLALVVHELATNSLKYGALSDNVVLLDISGSKTDDGVEIIWTEQGGPKVLQLDGKRRFGQHVNGYKIVEIDGPTFNVYEGSEQVGDDFPYSGEAAAFANCLSKRDDPPPVRIGPRF